jgi:hypothetical protein
MRPVAVACRTDTAGLESIFNDVLEIGQAEEHWRRVTTELKDRALMSPGNAASDEAVLEAEFCQSARNVGSDSYVDRHGWRFTLTLHRMPGDVWRWGLILGHGSGRSFPLCGCPDAMNAVLQCGAF